jgi:hypothetical protein
MNTLDSWAAFASTKINIAAFLAASRWAIYKTPHSDGVTPARTADPILLTTR